jgi:hypothetical protein
MEENKKTYTIEEVNEMMGGFQDEYFTKEQILFVYHSLNGNVEKAEYYKQKNIENELKLLEEFNKLKTEDEIKQINNDIKDEDN